MEEQIDGSNYDRATENSKHAEPRADRLTSAPYPPPTGNTEDDGC